MDNSGTKDSRIPASNKINLKFVYTYEHTYTLSHLHTYFHILLYTHTHGPLTRYELIQHSSLSHLYIHLSHSIIYYLDFLQGYLSDCSKEFAILSGFDYFKESNLRFS